MGAKRGLIFISNVHKALEHEWFADAMLYSDIKIDFVLFNSKDSELFNYLNEKGYSCTNYALSSKYFIPFYIVFFWIKLLFRPYDFVHCHLFEASLIGIISSKMAGINKRIYTRHHSDFHHTYFPGAVKYDDLINRYATHIIAISKGVKEILIKKENVSEKKIVTIPHGIPKHEMEKTSTSETITKMKNKYSLGEADPVVGVVSRFAIWKGVQFIIPAFKTFLKKYPKAKLVLANAQGEYESEIKELLNGLPSGSYELIKFENSMPALFASFDMFVHTPINEYCEAFGQVYIEAMCYGVPMICTISGVANDLVKNEKNALVVNYKNSDEIAKAMERMEEDPKLKAELIATAKLSVQDYSFEKKIEKLIYLYKL